MDENLRLAGRMAKIYAKLMGDLERLKNPPKRLLRLDRDREAYAAAEEERGRKAIAIEKALPHFAYVVNYLDPDWDRDTVEPIRPRERNRGIPPQGVSGQAMHILQDATEPLTIAEIVEIIAERYGIDLSQLSERQRYHTAVNNGLMHSYKDVLVEHPGYPTRWSWRGADE